MTGITTSLKRPLAIFDLDGTIRDTYQHVYPRPYHVRLFPGIQERIAEVKRLGFVAIGVTNQGGVSKGEISAAEVEAANARTQELLDTAALDAIYYCPHFAAKDGRNCDCKKPAPGLVLDALSSSDKLTLAGGFVVGDDLEKDGGLACCLGLPFIDAQRFRATTVSELGALIRSTQPVSPFYVPDPNRITGMLVGSAVGDALGAPLEFRSRAGIKQEYPDGLCDMIPSKIWEKGEFTDDTDMTIMVALALCCPSGFIETMSSYFRRWAMKPGLRLAETPELPRKDIGIATKAVIYRGADARAAREYYAEHPEGAAGNGALMRCSPVALFHLNSLSMLIADSRRAAMMTHADPKALSSCVILNVWLREILTRGTKDVRDQALAFVPTNESAPWERLRQIEHIGESEISSSGYVVSTLEAAAWSFLTTDTFDAAVVRAANLGDDADTVAAVTGALAGAYYGFHAISPDWRETLKAADFIRRLALEVVLHGLKYASETPAWIQTRSS